MEIKATLDKPYTEEQRTNFIVQYNHNLGYEIRETNLALEAWGYTTEELFEQAKQTKYAEANTKAFEYLESGEAVFEYEEGKSIEATDGNIAKLGLYLVKFLMSEDYTSTIEWNTKENENVQLNAEQLSYITEGLGAIQSEVWTVKFPAYNARIANAETKAEVEAILINYSVEFPPATESEEEEE